MTTRKTNGKPAERLLDGKNVGRGVSKKLADGLSNDRKKHIWAARTARALAKAHGLAPSSDLTREMRGILEVVENGAGVVIHGHGLRRMAPALGLRPIRLTPLEQRARMHRNAARKAQAAPALATIEKIKAHGAAHLARVFHGQPSDFLAMPGMCNLSSYRQGMVNAVFQSGPLRFVLEAWSHERTRPAAEDGIDPGFTMNVFLIVWHPESRCRVLAPVSSLADLGNALAEPGKYSQRHTATNGAAKHWLTPVAKPTEALAERLLGVVSEVMYVAATNYEVEES